MHVASVFFSDSNPQDMKVHGKVLLKLTTGGRRTLMRRRVVSNDDEDVLHNAEGETDYEVGIPIVGLKGEEPENNGQGYQANALLDNGSGVSTQRSYSLLTIMVTCLLSSVAVGLRRI